MCAIAEEVPPLTRLIQRIALGFAFLWAMLLASLGCLSGSTSAPRDTQAELADHVLSALLDVNETGTGFWVSESEMLTALHVVDPLPAFWSATITTRDGQRCYPAAVRSPGPEIDAALVTLSGCKPLAVLATRKDIPPPGESVFAAGFPYELGRTWSAGVVSNASRPDDDGVRLTFNAPILPGMSGGPVVDAYGRVVGVIAEAEVTRGTMQHPRVWGGFSYAVPMADLPADWP